MGCHEHRGAFAPRQRLHLSLPDEPGFDVGLTAADLRVVVNRDLETIDLEVADAGLAIVLSVTSAIDLILRLVGAVDRLQGCEP